jgi:hypothetical protein
VCTYLHTVVAVRVAQELFEARAVKQLLNEHLARGVLSDADALSHGNTLALAVSRRHQQHAPSQ